MRGTDQRPRVVEAARAGAVGALAGLLATGAMYGVAVIDLSLSGIGQASWNPTTEVAFGGNVGSVFGLSGPGLHALHGLAIGFVVGLVLVYNRVPRSWPTLAALVGVPLGIVLWSAVLLLSAATRSLQGPGPPLLLSLGMHLAFGVVVAVTLAWGNAHRPART